MKQEPQSVRPPRRGQVEQPSRLGAGRRGHGKWKGDQGESHKSVSGSLHMVEGLGVASGNVCIK